MIVRAFFVAIALALGVNAEPPSPQPERPVIPLPDSILAVFFQEVGPGSELVRVDPLSLKPSGRRVRLATGGGWVTAFSPDHRKLALAGGMGLASVEIVDVRRMRSVGVVDLKTRGTVSFLFWQPLGYLLAVVEDEHAAAIVTIDSVGGGVQTRHRIDGMILQAKSRTGQVVLLLGPRNRIGPLRLAVVGGKGMTSVAIPGFIGGSTTERTGEVVHAREEIPALVIDDNGRRALVFAGGSVAEVSLRDLSVTTHVLSEPVSLLDRFRNWVEPRAHAKLVEGFWREGIWLGDGRFAVTGLDYAMSTEGESGGKPFGLALIDTREWNIRKVAEGGTNLVLAEHTLLTFGYENDDGIKGYDLRSEKTFRLFHAGAGGWIQVVDGLVYAQLEDGKRYAVIDPALRRRIGQTRVAQPIALVEGQLFRHSAVLFAAKEANGRVRSVWRSDRAAISLLPMVLRAAPPQADGILPRRPRQGAPRLPLPRRRGETGALQRLERSRRGRGRRRALGRGSRPAGRLRRPDVRQTDDARGRHSARVTA